MFKVNKKDICSNSRIQILEWRDVFIVNFERISHLVLVFLLLTLNMQLPAGYGSHHQNPAYDSLVFQSCLFIHSNLDCSRVICTQMQAVFDLI